MFHKQKLLSCLPSVACSQVCIHSIDEATDVSVSL